MRGSFPAALRSEKSDLRDLIGGDCVSVVIGIQMAGPIYLGPAKPPPPFLFE